MFLSSLLIFLGGLFLALDGLVCSVVGLRIGTVRTLLWNRIAGSALVLTVVVIFFGPMDFKRQLFFVPISLYGAGILVALSMAINIFVLPRLGATKSVLLVLAGDLIVSTLVDSQQGHIRSLCAAVIGIALLFAGITMAEIGNRNE